MAVSRPPLGQLTFDDGQVVVLNQGCVLGRTPNADEHEGSTTIPLDGKKISRQHAAVILDGWNVLVDDLGSTNGTIVVLAPGTPPIEVEPGTPLRLDERATVYLGSRSFTYDTAGEV